ncbi:hypothetical protein H1C71_012001 [Ictidomys tridecemlineatus]|nr:hypothetical protein H1C71_012001 [Ictidomys tridecemlineatus]
MALSPCPGGARTPAGGLCPGPITSQRPVPNTGLGEASADTQGMPAPGHSVRLGCSLASPCHGHRVPAGVPPRTSPCPSHRVSPCWGAAWRPCALVIGSLLGCSLASPCPRPPAWIRVPPTGLIPGPCQGPSSPRPHRPGLWVSCPLHAPHSHSELAWVPGEMRETGPVCRSCLSPAALALTPPSAHWAQGLHGASPGASFPRWSGASGASPGCAQVFLPLVPPSSYPCPLRRLVHQQMAPPPAWPDPPGAFPVDLGPGHSLAGVSSWEPGAQGWLVMGGWPLTLEAWV